MVVATNAPRGTRLGLMPRSLVKASGMRHDFTLEKSQPIYA